MFDSNRYWKQVDATADKIAEDWPHIVGVDDPSRGLTVGSPVQVSREEAAKAIVENRGRLATPEEIAAESARLAVVMEKFRQTEQEKALRNMLFPHIQQPQPQPSTQKKG